jgi:hypothetical protein
MNDATLSLRRQVYWLLITVALGAAVGRILSAERVYEPSLAPPPGVQADGRHQAWPAEQPPPMPTFGSNDRSRWDTVRALVDEGTFVIGKRDRGLLAASDCGGLAATDGVSLTAILRMEEEERAHGCDRGIVFEPGNRWFTVDKVLDPERMQYYSSKPPLLTVLMACEYWALKRAFGWEITERPNEVVRVGLVTFNALPLVLYLWLLGRLAERYGATDWGRLFVLAAAAFGTLLTPFLITFNNHVPAAFAALFALCAALPVAFPAEDCGRSRSRLADVGRLVLAGLAAGCLFNFELPAAAFVAALTLLLLVRAPFRTLLFFAPPVLLLVAAFFLLNHAATGQWLPVYEKLDTPWYQYPGSVWSTVHAGGGRGIEFAREHESRWMYAFHLLFGHHGWFSLTPINLLGLAGMVAAVVALGRRRATAVPAVRAGPNTAETAVPQRGWAVTAAGSLAVSVVVFVFYAFVTETANYGGWTNGPRWLLWLTPLWLLAMLPVADRLGRRRWGRALCLVLLALAVLSASFSLWNPWRPPWIYRWLDSQNWLPY